jgi:hypothetical protein
VRNENRRIEEGTWRGRSVFLGLDRTDRRRNAESRNEDGKRLADQAPEVIERLDRITCGAPKIVYLVGWQ